LNFAEGIDIHLPLEYVDVVATRTDRFDPKTLFLIGSHTIGELLRLSQNGVLECSLLSRMVCLGCWLHPSEGFDMFLPLKPDTIVPFVI
jgi:hypothetical protein